MCKLTIMVLAGSYLVALAIFLIGTFGLFGQDRDPLSGVFLMPLGLPWNRMTNMAPEVLWSWLAALAPLVNIGLLATLCRWFSSR
jgi:hypothetical protein